MSETTPAIVINHLAYAYGRSEAVHDFNLTVPKGKCYGLFGRNGAGKTTTMKCLLNLLRPRAGQLSVLGLDPIRQDVEVKRRLSYVPDFVAFYPAEDYHQDYYANNPGQPYCQIVIAPKVAKVRKAYFDRLVKHT